MLLKQIYDFLIDIPFKENSSLVWSALSILMHCVIDTNHHWSAVLLTPSTTVHLPLIDF
jgi:hypothetical protein